MGANVTRLGTGFLVLLLFLVAWRLVAAQLDGLEGMEPPPDVSGMDCTMCHGDFAANFEYTHQPALDGECALCHLETGEAGHGGLVSADRELCLTCHAEYTAHNPVLTCWAATCHADVHGSNEDPLLNPSRQEEYPGFCESTAGAQYIGSGECLGCHYEYADWWKRSIHSLSDTDRDSPYDRRGCEGCHGPGSNHWGRWAGIGYFELSSVEEADAVCFKCHRDEIYEADYWKTLHPLAGVACTTCHDPHFLENPSNLTMPANQLCFSCHKTVRADFNKLSHHPVDNEDPRTGMLCTDCHSPHCAEGRPMLQLPKDELCVSCHVDKSGPFVYDHVGYDPALGDGCFTCHSQHGSNSPNLLMMNGRGVCLQCHSDLASHGGAATCWSTGCHTEHHGSNGNFFFFN